jgi:hypothetical protein
MRMNTLIVSKIELLLVYSNERKYFQYIRLVIVVLSQMEQHIDEVKFTSETKLCVQSCLQLQ